MPLITTYLCPGVLGCKTVTEAILRFWLLSYLKESGLLGTTNADLSRDEGLDDNLLKHEPIMAETAPLPTNALLLPSKMM